jgi:hypothetical protein
MHNARQLVVASRYLWMTGAGLLATAIGLAAGETYFGLILPASALVLGGLAGVGGTCLGAFLVVESVRPA